MIDEWQLTEARAHGADAVLLIVAALPGSQLDELYVAANEEGLDVLVEVHDETEMERAAAIGAALIGINNRDLKTFNTSTDVTRRLAPLAPEGALLVSESGLGQAGELGQLEEIGVTAFLLGESLMSAADPGAALAGLLVP
jgi:indole-3-glycerol phosphate synthase